MPFKKGNAYGCRDGRPPKPADEKRDVLKTIKLTDAEWAEIDLKAKTLGFKSRTAFLVKAARAYME